MKTPLVSIIIPAYEGDVQKVKTTIANQTLKNCELVVSFGVSPAALARNRGARKATGTYLIFLDDDVTFNRPDTLATIIETLVNLPRKDAVTLTWRLPPKANWLQQTLWGKPNYTFASDRHVTPLSWRECGAACFAIRSEWFQSLGGYDSTLISAEDCDLGYRLTRSGGELHTLPEFWVEHCPPKTIGDAIKKTLWYERGNAQMARKNPQADYRVRLDRTWKALGYLTLHCVAVIPLIFLRVNYRQRWPRIAFRPLAALLTFLGAWAYSLEWLIPNRTWKDSPSSKMISNLKDEN